MQHSRVLPMSWPFSAKALRRTLQPHRRCCTCPSIIATMYFGFAVGDFIAVGKLVCDIELRTCLRHRTSKLFATSNFEVVCDIELRSTAVSPDPRWTYLQAPLRVEDALGFQFPVPSEYSYVTLIAVIQSCFKEGAGASEIRAGNYELSRTNRRSELVSAKTHLTPGTAITVAIVIVTKTARDSSCPRPGCGSSEISPCLGCALACEVTNEVNRATFSY
jgi:hypothetical protein